MMVERRDQVLMTFFSPLELSTSTFFNRWSSTNGPFFKLRGISAQPFAYRRAPRVRRRRTIIESDFLLRDRVRPSALPHGETGWRPPMAATMVRRREQPGGVTNHGQSRDVCSTCDSLCSFRLSFFTICRSPFGTRTIR